MVDDKVKLEGGLTATTPSSAFMIKLMGSPMHAQGTSVVLTRNEYSCVREYLGYTSEAEVREGHAKDLERDMAKHEDMVQEAAKVQEAGWGERRDLEEAFEAKYGRSPSNLKEPMTLEERVAFTHAGEGRDIGRHFKGPGFRVMAFLSQFMEPGEDPVKFVGRLIMESGMYETDPGDNEWFMEG